MLGSTRYSELQRGVPGISPSLLSQRLQNLERAGIISIHGQRQGRSYVLTEAGRELEPMLNAMAQWGHRWVRSDYRDEDLDPSFLMIDIRRNLPRTPLDENRRVVMEFAFPTVHGPSNVFWLVAEPDGHTDLCYLDPGFDVDLRLDCELRALTKVWMGDLAWTDALRSGQLRIIGPRPLSTRVPGWIGRHDLAAVPRG